MRTALLHKIIIACFAVLVLGCEQEGPAEQAVERIDSMVEEGGERLEQAGDEIREQTGD